MSFFTALPIVGKIIEKGLDVVDQFITDKDKANEIKGAIRQQIEVQNHNEALAEIKAQAGIVMAEAAGESCLQRNWRPILMLVIVFIIFNNYVLFPYLSLFTEKVTMLELPGGLWALLNVGVGGYVVGRSAEKILKKTIL